MRSSLLPFEELNIDNGDLLTNSEYYDRSNTNIPLHHALNQVDSNTNLLDKLILTEVVLQSTEKPRCVGPHKSISKKNGNKRKLCLGNKKFRSVNKPLYGTPADSNSNNGLKSPRHLLYKSKYKNKYPLRTNSTSIPTVCWKITKKQSSLMIYQSMVVYHIVDSVTGLNWILTQQACQIKINDCYIVSSKTFIHTWNYCTKRTSSCIIHYHENGIINHLSGKRPLASRYVISEEITTVCIVIYRRTFCTFGIIVFETY